MMVEALAHNEKVSLHCNGRGVGSQAKSIVHLEQVRVGFRFAT